MQQRGLEKTCYQSDSYNVKKNVRVGVKNLLNGSENNTSEGPSADAIVKKISRSKIIIVRLGGQRDL